MTLILFNLILGSVDVFYYGIGQQSWPNAAVGSAAFFIAGLLTSTRAMGH